MVENATIYWVRKNRVNEYLELCSTTGTRPGKGKYGTKEAAFLAYQARLDAKFAECAKTFDALCLEQYHLHELMADEASDKKECKKDE